MKHNNSPLNEESPEWIEYITSIAKNASDEAFNKAQLAGQEILVMEDKKLVYLLPNGKKRAYKHALQKN